MDCTNCPWANPDTCRQCKLDEAERERENASKK